MHSRLLVHKKPLSALILCLILAAAAGGETPEWTLLGPGGGPQDYRFMSLDPQDGRVIFAGGYDGIYKSLDRGETWRWLKSGGDTFTAVVDPLG